MKTLLFILIAVLFASCYNYPNKRITAVVNGKDTVSFLNEYDNVSIFEGHLYSDRDMVYTDCKFYSIIKIDTLK